MEGVLNNSVPLIQVTSQPKEALWLSTWDGRTWISINRKLLTEKITKQLTFCLFCLDSLETQMEEHMLRHSEARWFQRSMQSRVHADISFKNFLGICLHPTLSFLSSCLGAGILLHGVTEWIWVFSFICGDPDSDLLYLREGHFSHKDLVWVLPVPSFIVQATWIREEQIVYSPLRNKTCFWHP